MSETISIPVPYSNNLHRSNPLNAMVLLHLGLFLSAAYSVGIYNHPNQKVEYNYNIEHLIYTKPTSALTTGVIPLIGKNPNIFSIEELYSEVESFLPGINTQYVLGVPSKIDSLENFRPMKPKRLDTIAILPYNHQNVIRTEPCDEDYI